MEPISPQRKYKQPASKAGKRVRAAIISESQPIKRYVVVIEPIRSRCKYGVFGGKIKANGLQNCGYVLRVLVESATTTET